MIIIRIGFSSSRIDSKVMTTILNRRKMSQMMITTPIITLDEQTSRSMIQIPVTKVKPRVVVAEHLKVTTLTR